MVVNLLILCLLLSGHRSFPILRYLRQEKLPLPGKDLRMAPTRHPSETRLLPTGFRVAHITVSQEGLILVSEPEADSVRCPLCNSSSERVHSRYSRTVSDLPWRGIIVTVKIRARKFF